MRGLRDAQKSTKEVECFTALRCYFQQMTPQESAGQRLSDLGVSEPPRRLVKTDCCVLPPGFLIQEIQVEPENLYL